ncbi:MAG: hypothetical protein QUS14_00355 [Pyrinomonadaceae bacterium]|nr:hypothetical protein [Pyrinomonadaceae bacterium]
MTQSPPQLKVPAEAALGPELPVAVRTPPAVYVGLGFVLLFLAAFLFYLDLGLYALLVVIAAVVVVPLLATFDKIVFDGKRIRRTGILFRMSSQMFGQRDRLKLSDIEHVDTQALRMVNRGGRIAYRFRTGIHGKGVMFTIAGGGDRYRKMVQAILPRLDANVLDTRSLELRNYLASPDEVRLRANLSNIPPSDVIEPTLSQSLQRRRKDRAVPFADPEQAMVLRQLANELRFTGSVVRALEAFRRALVLAPSDPWLLFDSARCLHSFSGARRDARLERRSRAMMRLAERRAGSDGELLSMIGESYSQMGDWDRAAAVFRRIGETIGGSFRSLRGQAEIALREGKIAHVIHNFAAANRLSTTDSLRRWTQSEVDYFTRLNEDEDYMELEVSRVNLLDSLARFRRTAVKLIVLGSLIVIGGVLFGSFLAANVGWAVSLSALAVWIVMHIARRMLEARIPFDLVDDCLLYTSPSPPDSAVFLGFGLLL